MTNIPDLSTFTPKATTTRLTDSIAAWVTAACTGSDQITWDVSLTLIPTQQGMQAGTMLILRMPSPILGQHLTHIVLGDLDSLTQPAVTAQVRDALERLRAQRSELLAAPVSNGGSA